jgi:hypothetical protein
VLALAALVVGARIGSLPRALWLQRKRRSVEDTLKRSEMSTMAVYGEGAADLGSLGFCWADVLLVGVDLPSSASTRSRRVSKSELLG